MLPAIDPVIHQPQRLRILAALYRNRQASFVVLQRGLGLTSGNLASHAAKLEEAGFLESSRVLADLSFEVRFRITPRGIEAFHAYLASLKALVESVGLEEAPQVASGGEDEPLVRAGEAWEL